MSWLVLISINNYFKTFKHKKNTVLKVLLTIVCSRLNVNWLLFFTKFKNFNKINVFGTTYKS